jgi:hypothetical protein
MEVSEFVWTFPVYILATNYSFDTPSEDIIFDEKIRFITPEAFPGGPRAIALFTDVELAAEFRGQSTLDVKLDLVSFVLPGALKRFLQRALTDYLLVVVDMNRKTHRSQPFGIHELLPVLDRLDRREDSDSR